MATAEQRAALLDVTCPWCGATPGQACYVQQPHRRATVRVARDGRRSDRAALTTLDAGAHDARWQAALGVSAPVRESPALTPA